MNPFNLSCHHFGKFLRRAGLPKIRFHDLRQILATMMFSELSAHPKAVQGMFGHKDVKITMDTCIHYLPTMQGPYVARLDEFFGEWTKTPPSERLLARLWSSYGQIRYSNISVQCVAIVNYLQNSGKYASLN